MKNIINVSILALLLCVSVNLNAQLKVKTDGNVKIGSESPWPSGGKLEITGKDETLEARVFVGSPNIARYWAANSIYAFGFGIDQSGIGRIYKGLGSSSSIMSFNSSGNFSIGTSSVYSSYRLYIYGNFRAYGEVTCRDGYWASSDVRLKSNISPIDGALNKVMNLNGKTYNLKSTNLKSSTENAKINYGLIAQEVKEIIPELVKETEDSISSLAINYDGLIPVLIEAIKENNKIQLMS